MAASSKASGFTEAVMQMNFWISHDLVHLKTFRSNWHFWHYFWRTHASRRLLYWYILFLTKKGWNKLIFWISQISFCADLYCNNHIVTSMLLSLGAIGPVVEEVWVGTPHPESGLYQVWGSWASGMRRYNIFGFHAILRVRFPHPKSPHWYVWGL